MRCTSRTRRGRRCRARALLGGTLCAYHDPRNASAAREARRRGGLARMVQLDRDRAALRRTRAQLRQARTAAADVLDSLREIIAARRPIPGAELLRFVEVLGPVAEPTKVAPEPGGS